MVFIGTMHTAYSVSGGTTKKLTLKPIDTISDSEPRRVLREEWSKDIWKRGNRAAFGCSNNCLYDRHGLCYKLPKSEL